MPLAFSILIAVLIGVVIWKVGMSLVRSFSLPPAGEDDPTRAPATGPEDVDDLDVYLVCGVCGTEFKVSRLGELQIPRHCGEKMLVVRRPRTETAESGQD
jgi:DNA-directed RNA polymerase subunit RPC12/RpoP